MARLLKEPPVLSFTDTVTLLSWKTMHHFLIDRASTALGQVLYAGAAPSSLQKEYPGLPAEAKQMWVDCLAHGITERIVAEAEHYRTVEIVAMAALMWDAFQPNEQTELAEAMMYALSRPDLLYGRLQQICGNSKIREIVRTVERDSLHKVFNSVLAAAKDAHSNERMAALEFLDDLRDILPASIGGRYVSLLLASWEISIASDLVNLIDRVRDRPWDVLKEEINNFINERLAEVIPTGRSTVAAEWQNSLSALLSVSFKADDDQYGRLLSAIRTRLDFGGTQQPHPDQQEAMTIILPKLASVVDGRGWKDDTGSAVQWANAWFQYYLLQEPEQLSKIALLLGALGGEEAVEKTGQMAENTFRQSGGSPFAANIAPTLAPLSEVSPALANHLAVGLSFHIGRETPDESIAAVLAQLNDEQVLQLFHRLLANREAGVSEQAIRVYALLPEERKTQPLLEQMQQTLQRMASHAGRRPQHYQVCVVLAVQAAIDANTDIAFEGMKEVLRLACNTHDGMLGTAKGLMKVVEGTLTQYLMQDPALSGSFDVLITTMLDAIKPSEEMQGPQAELLVEALEVLAPALQSHHKGPIRTADDRAQQAGWDTVHTALEKLLK